MSPLGGRPRGYPEQIRGFVLPALGLQENFVRAAVAAEVDHLGLALVELAQQIDGPRTGDQDELHRFAEPAEAHFLVNLPELPGQVELGCPARVGGEEQDLDHRRPNLGWVRKGEVVFLKDLNSRSKEEVFSAIVNEPIDDGRRSDTILAPG